MGRRTMIRRFAGQAWMIARSFAAARRGRGVARTARLALHEVLFDLRHGTDTSMEPPGRATAHEGTNQLLFAEILRQAGFAADGRALVDFGAGKGRALMLAAEHGFGTAIGVESSPELCAIATANIARYGRRRPGALSVTCADAASFEVPPEVTVAYLFNPFGADTMSAVVDRIRESLDRAPREFHVVYLNPRHAGPFLGAGFIVDHRRPDALLLRRPR
ncbi:class I SAM-dependent methyltransferase [Sphaerisporangium sp. NPDC005289]|uniref:class I SAM-dependent methyltransferase n=1 Tax=Sphaerisporangium sp. NPDC005289 TaxID=3155247 RepID=UPI0033A7E5DC